MIWEILVPGLTLGSIYALAGVSINIIYRPTNTFNLAQGDLVMLGGIVCATVISAAGFPWLAAVLVTLAGGCVIAVATDILAVAPILAARRGSAHGWIISTLATAIIIENIVGKLVGPDPKLIPPPPLLSVRPIHYGGLGISSYQIFLVIAVLLLVLAAELFYRSRMGKAILAVAEDREATLLLGIDPRKLARVSFAISGGVAALTGILAGPILYASIPLGGLMLIKGFEVAAIGGIGVNRGAILGGYLLGVVELLTASELSPGFQDAVTFLVMLTVLLLRPQGFFGTVTLRTV